jgi:hypothetical protein
VSARTALVAALVAGCAAGKPAPVNTNVGDGSASDAGMGRCTGNTTCGGGAANTIYACDASHNTGQLLYTCDDGLVCSLGRCATPPCATGEKRASITGCLFYIAILDNVDSDQAKPTLIIVTNPSTTMTAIVQLQERTDPRTWSDPPSIAVAAGSAASFSVVNAQSARRVVSDMPVSVMMVESDDSDSMATSSSGTVVLPAHSLGTNYMTMSYQQVDTTKVAAIPGSRGGAAEIAVVATQDNTSLWIYAPTLPPMAMPMPVTLAHDGDIFHISSSCNLDNEAGTVIAADQRVAVFSGNITTTYGQNVEGLNSPDMAMEQMIPTGTWSRTWVAARLPPQDHTCDSIFPTGANSYWQVIAAEATNITFTTASGQPLPGAPSDFHLAKGVAYPYWVGGSEDFVIKGDKPILVTQGLDCEPTLSTAIPVDAATDVQVFTLAPNFDHMLAIVRKNDGNGRVLLDGIDITDQFTLIAGGFEVARVPVAACSGTVDHCVHRLYGAFGLSLRGMDVSSSYSTTFPSWAECVGDTCPTSPIF